MTDVKIAFERRIVVVPLANIFPSKILPTSVLETLKYKRIIASVVQLGLIEPLSVARQRDGSYLLVDGHIRLDALKQQNATEAKCIVADDDESFTYNKRINRLPPIQEHHMIVRALEKGVSEEKLARSLDVDVKVIRQRRDMLAGISPDVAEILKDKTMSVTSFSKIRKMKPIRQLEVAELMISANNFTFSYVSALLASTKPSDLHKPEDIAKATGLTTEQMARLEREMSSLSETYKEMEASYGDDMLILVIAAGYIERLLSKPDIEHFLASYHSEILETFRTIVVASSLDEPALAVA